jgi:predicted homoserine dehydrogenase-like protein
MRVAIVGAGFIGSGLAFALAARTDMTLARIVTRRSRVVAQHLPSQLVTDSVDEAIEHSDLVIECTGDVAYGAATAVAVLAAGKPLVTINAELQITVGSALATRGYVTEAEGDQPGCLAALLAESRAMGFSPLVLGNMKRFLNINPSAEDMAHWSARLGTRLRQVISFTDGTKVNIEHALVANGLDAELAMPFGLMGVASVDLACGAGVLAREAMSQGMCLTDYVLCPSAPPGVFIVASHDPAQQTYLKYLGLGDGPNYLLRRDYHLCHLEVAKTLTRVAQQLPPLLTNSRSPRYGVCAVAKQELKAGTRLTHGIGSFDVRGVAFRLADRPDLVPIGLLQDAELRRAVAEGEPIKVADVALQDTVAHRLWTEHRPTLIAGPAR